MPADGRRPVLWHLAMSHYSEKARWALDYKEVRHTRRAVMPGLHAPMAKLLGGGESFPVMTIGGAVYNDSTDILAALEQLRPDPPLYPPEPEQRARALALEDEFDRVSVPRSATRMPSRQRATRRRSTP